MVVVSFVEKDGCYWVEEWGVAGPSPKKEDMDRKEGHSDITACLLPLL